MLRLSEFADIAFGLVFIFMLSDRLNTFLHLIAFMKIQFDINLNWSFSFICSRMALLERLPLNLLVLVVLTTKV